MNNKSLPFADLATHYARHLQKDENASEYLTQQGWLLAKPQVSEITEEKTEPKVPSAASISGNRTTVKKPKKQLDFPVFLLRQKTPYPTDEPDELTGLSYENQPKKTHSPLPDKPPIESLVNVIEHIGTSLTASDSSYAIDVKKLVKQVAQQKQIDPLPRLSSKSPPQHLRILIDKSHGWFGLQDEAFELATYLQQYWPECKTQVLVLPNGPGAEWGFRGEDTRKEAMPLPEADSAVLIIARFEKQLLSVWQGILKQWQKRTKHIVWLTTSIPDRDTRSELPVTWLPWGVQQSQPTTNTDILMAVAMTMHYMPGALLRRLIQFWNLPARCEAEFSQHPETEYHPGSDFWENQAPEPARKQALKQVLNGLAAHQIQQLNTLIESHLEPLGPELLHEYRIAMHLACDHFQCPNIQQSYDYFASMGVSLKQQSTGMYTIASFLKESIQRFGEDVAQADRRLKQTLGQACRYLAQHKQQAQIPESLAQHTLNAMAKHTQNRQMLDIQQQGQKLTLQSKPKVQDKLTLKTNSFTQIKAGDREPLFLREGDLILHDEKPNQSGSQADNPKAINTQVTNLQAIHRKLPPNLPKDVVLQSQFEALSITRRSVNDFWWAKRLSITARGVVAETEHINVVWPADREGFQVNDWQAKAAFFDDQSRAFICVKQDAPDYYIGNYPRVDKFGLYIPWQIESKVGWQIFNMRYMPPGSFLMGSPEDEAQRDDDETQHPVTLTQGFWLAETTVMQTLWQAVMGQNPSEFKPENNEQLPVDSVSWYDSQAFCQKLSELTGAEFSLPSEAQWEYACRAGTTTPFHTGEQLGFEQGNYDVNLPYEGKEVFKLKPNQKFRDKTVDVHQFKANQWGLKQMHGNVREWCQDDWQEEMTSEHQTDPLVSGNEAADAVLRGGSWYNNGQDCRSAYRNYLSRVGRLSVIGLRLTQVLKKKESVQA